MQEKPNPEAYRPPFDKPLTDEKQRAMMRDLVIGPNMLFRDNL
jgi:hypothetical protein